MFAFLANSILKLKSPLKGNFQAYLVIIISAVSGL